MPDVLQQILVAKRREVEQRRAARPLSALAAEPGFALPRRNFYGAVSVPRRRPNLIAEIKKASPSAGLIRADFDPVRIARAYEQGGAAALSVLTDQEFFQGRLEFIEQVKLAVGLPVLRKDFVIDPYQVDESRAAGADALLLIAEALSLETLVRLYRRARELELCVLVEAHSADALAGVLGALPPAARDGLLLGLNNRDLAAQRTDLSVAERLAALCPPGLPLVAESGIATRADVDRMHAIGARALLIGETLMRCDDPAAKIRELIG